MGLAGEKWREMDDDSKAPYEKMYSEDKERFEKQMAEWNKNGYYTMEDGTKSTELAAKSRKTLKELEGASDTGTPAKRKSSAKKVAVSAKRS